MNILVVSQYYYPEPFRINEICEELVARGHSVTVVTGIPNYPDGEFYEGYRNVSLEENINGVKVIRCKIRPRKTGNKNLALNYLSYCISANKTLKKMKENFDLVYGYQLSPITSMIPAKRMAERKRIPFYLYCLDIWPESIVSVFNKNSFSFRIIKYISKRIYSSADKIGVSSPSFKSYLSNLLGCEYNISYNPQHSSDLFHSNKLIKKSSPFINFVFVGNIGSSQNIEGVLEALSNVKEKNRFRIHFVGSGSALEIVEKKSIELGLESIVVFHGRQPQSELSKYYQIADVCIVSLRKEGGVGLTIPGKLQEYMSAGKAILAFLDGDATWIVEDAKCGITVPAEDTNLLKDAFMSFLDNEKNTYWGRNARIYYETHFTLDSHVSFLECELNNCLGKNESSIN